MSEIKGAGIMPTKVKKRYQISWANQNDTSDITWIEVIDGETIRHWCRNGDPVELSEDEYRTIMSCRTGMYKEYDPSGGRNYDSVDEIAKTRSNKRQAYVYEYQLVQM